MKIHRIGSWLGPALGITGILVGLAASDAAQGAAYAGLLAGSLCAVWGISLSSQRRRAV